MFLWKRRSFEYRHCRCLARIAIALNRCSVYRQIQSTKPPEHLCLLNKLLQLVLVRVLTWSCYMIGVILIFQSLCQKNTFSWRLRHVCLSHQYTPGYTPISYSLRLSRSGIYGRQRPQKWIKAGSYSRRPFPSLPHPPFSLFPYPLPLSTPATQASTLLNNDIWKKKVEIKAGRNIFGWFFIRVSPSNSTQVIPPGHSLMKEKPNGFGCYQDPLQCFLNISV